MGERERPSHRREPSTSSLYMQLLSSLASDLDFMLTDLCPSPPPHSSPLTVIRLPPWTPYYASERLEDPNNPPPMFHPMFANEWRYDPNISEDLRNFYSSTCSEFSPFFGIFDYGRLSEFNTLNLYDPERFPDPKDTLSSCPVPPSHAPRDDNTEVFGDPHEALARSTADVPDKYRKEKWRYFELKKRLELFKKLGMESDLAMYEGQLERMEADPWTGDSSGRDVEVYVRGYEGDPALDDTLLEGMEALVAPTNEGRRAFWAAMENPPPIRDERGYGSSEDCGEWGRMDQLVAPTREGRRAFLTAMENPPPIRDEGLNDSFETCPEGDDSQMSADGGHTLNTTFSLSDDDSVVNTAFTVPGDDPNVPPSDGC